MLIVKKQEEIMSLHLGKTQLCDLFTSNVLLLLLPMHLILGKVLFKPRWSSNTACLADYVKGEPLGLLHEEQEFIHNTSIVGSVPILGVIKGQHGAPKFPVYPDMLIPQCSFLRSSARTAWNQLSAK